MNQSIDCAWKRSVNLFALAVYMKIQCTTPFVHILCCGLSLVSCDCASAMHCYGPKNSICMILSVSAKKCGYPQIYIRGSISVHL